MTDKKSPAQSSLRAGEFWIGALVVLGCVAFLYSPSLQNGWSNWDDRQYVQTNPDIRNLDTAPLDTLEMLFSKTYVGGYTPLTMVSYALDFQRGEIEGEEIPVRPEVFHQTAFALHLLNTLLVLLVTRMLFLAARSRKTLDLNTQVIDIASLLAAALFAFHPLQAETVCWIAERKGILHAPFFLTAVLCHLRAVKPEERGLSSSGIWHGITALFMALSLLCKQTAITLPIALLLLDIYPLKRLKFERQNNRPWIFSRPILDKIPLGIVAILGIVRAITAASGGVEQMSDRHLGERFGLMFWSELFLFTKLIVPISLSGWYSLPFDLSDAYPQMWLAAVVVPTALLAMFLLRKKAPGLLAAWISWLLLLLPVSGIIPWGRHLIADRYAYLPMLPWIWLVLAWALPRAQRKGPKVWFGVLGGLLLILSTFFVATRGRIGVWKSPITIAKDQIASGTPQIDMPHNNLGNYYMANQDVERATFHFAQAMEINPRNHRPYYNLGLLAKMKGDTGRAETLFREAIERFPEYDLAYTQLLEVIYPQKRWSDVLALTTSAQEKVPFAADWTSFRLRALLELYRFGEFDEITQELSQVDRDRVEIQLILTERYLFQKQLQKAVETLQPLPESKLNAAWRERKNKLPVQWKGLQKRIEVLDQSPNVTAALMGQKAQVLFELGRFDECQEALEAASTEVQNQALCAFMRARIAVLEERREDAKRDLQRAKELGLSMSLIQQARELKSLE